MSRVALIVKGWEIEQKKAERPPPPPPPPAKAVKGKGDIIAVPSWSEQERDGEHVRGNGKESMTPEVVLIAFVVCCRR